MDFDNIRPDFTNFNHADAEDDPSLDEAIAVIAAAIRSVKMRAFTPAQVADLAGLGADILDGISEQPGLNWWQSGLLSGAASLLTGYEVRMQEADRVSRA